MSQKCQRGIQISRISKETQIRVQNYKCGKNTFNPLSFACTGGAGPSATKVITRLAAKINEKGTESYADAISYIRTKISFALLRSSVLCLRGCRATRRQQAIVESSISAIVHEGGLS